MVRTAESNKSTRHTHARKHINYVDLNTGIDSEPDYSPPRKKKCDVVAALREPSQTVISAHWQCITRQGLRKMFPSPEHKTLKLVGTVIISPPGEDTVVKQRNKARRRLAEITEKRTYRH